MEAEGERYMKQSLRVDAAMSYGSLNESLDQEHENIFVKKKKTNIILHDVFDQIFVPWKSTKEKERAESKLQTAPVDCKQLFRYATLHERLLVGVGVVLSACSSLGGPAHIVLYAEFASLLVDRNTEGITSNKSPAIQFFGGGRILVNGTHEQRMAAMQEDSVAFAIGNFSALTAELILCSIAISLLNIAALRQVRRIRALFLKALLRQDQAWHDVHGTASIATRLTDDLEKLQGGIGESIGIFVFFITGLLTTVAVSFFYGWKLALVVACFAPIIVIAQTAISKMQSSMMKKELVSYGAAGAVVEEVIGAIRTVVAFGGEKKEADRYEKNLEPANEMGIKRNLNSGIGAGFMWFITYVSYAVAFWYGVHLFLEDKSKVEKQYTTGTIIIVFIGITEAVLKIDFAMPHIQTFNLARSAASFVYHVIEHTPGIDSLSEVGARPDHVTGDIELRGVTFNYPARSEVKVLDGLHLTVPHGKTVALVGPSGCGKSTVLQLIQRLYDPAQGSVLVDGVDVRELNVQWLRGRIGVVGQEPVLFNTTIRENIRYGVVEAKDKDIEQAAREANAHDFISRLPQGYDTLVGDGGAQLSGGQKQRVAIARALVRRPVILLLDEATSALDRASEVNVQAALDRASQGRTTIVVSHRLATIRHADHIVVMSDGGVVEQGTHDELMTLRGRYFGLVQANVALPRANDYEDYETKGFKPSLFKTIRLASTLDDKGNDISLNSYNMQDESYAASIRRIMYLNRSEKFLIAVGCFASFVAGCHFPAFYVVFGKVIGTLSLADTKVVEHMMNIYSLLLLLIGISAGVAIFVQTYVFGLIGVRLSTRLRTQVFSAILEQEIGWFDDERNSVGALCARLAGDAASVQGATGSRISVILQSVATLLVGLTVSMIFSWNLTLVSIVVVPITLSAVYLEFKFFASEVLVESASLQAATKIAVEAISQVRTVASLGGEMAVLTRYEAELEASLKAGRKKRRLRGLVFTLGQALPFMCFSLIFWYGGLLIAHEGLPYESLIIIEETLIIGTWMVGQAMIYAPNLSEARDAARRLIKILGRKSLIEDPQNQDSNVVKNLSGNVEFSKVGFSYPTRPDVSVLRDLDLLVSPGKTVAVVGASGCGKSTCIQLLQRLYDPTSGKLRMSDVDVTDLRLERLRGELGIVSQEPVLFDRTIAENIAYGVNTRHVEQHEITAAAEKANIHDFIASLPQGYHTRLGSKGTQLSGGQKQRVAIARALLRNPRILLLDEATSALDTQSEKVVQAALDAAREGRTCIVIAHRLATIQHADLICVLHQGAVVEAGTHAELLALGGHYCQLHQQAGIA